MEKINSIQRLKKQTNSKENYEDILPNIIYNVLEKDLEIIFPYNNPYLNLPDAILNKIAKERSFEYYKENNEKTFGVLNKAQQLFELDKILPDWIYTVLNKNVYTFETLIGTKVYVYAALNNVNVINYNFLNNIDFIKYIRISVLLKNKIQNEEILMSELSSCKEEILNIFILKFNISQDILKFIEKKDIISAIIKDSKKFLKLNKAEEFLKRYIYINEHKYSHMIKKLYKIENEKKLIENCKITNFHPMENIIKLFSKSSTDKTILESIIKLFGIVIPLSYKNNIELYIEENLLSYIKVLKRGKLKNIPLDSLSLLTDRKIKNRISCLKDEELFKYLGIYVPYNNRDQLINNLISIIREKKFIYPIERSKKRSLNETTLLYTDVEDKKTFLICYGNLLKYYTYEIQELIYSFNIDFKKRGIISFKHPEDNSIIFNKEEIENLLNLLNCFPMSNDIKKLIEIIKDGLLELNEQSIYDKDIIIEFSTLQLDEKENINLFLKKIIDIGMYMRKWKGPGYPYPLCEADTINGEYTKENVTSNIGEALEILKKMKTDLKLFCMNLKMCQYNKAGILENNLRTFEFIWNTVIKGDACIRMASSEFIGTGVHYLRIFFRETIPGIDVKNIDRIN